MKSQNDRTQEIFINKVRDYFRNENYTGRNAGTIETNIIEAIGELEEEKITSTNKGSGAIQSLRRKSTVPSGLLIRISN